LGHTYTMTPKSLFTLMKQESKLKGLHASSEASCVTISTKTPPELYRRRSEMLYNLATPINYSPVLVHKPIFRSTSDCTPVQWQIETTNGQVSINQSINQTPWISPIIEMKLFCGTGIRSSFKHNNKARCTAALLIHSS